MMTLMTAQTPPVRIGTLSCWCLTAMLLKDAEDNEGEPHGSVTRD